MVTQPDDPALEALLEALRPRYPDVVETTLRDVAAYSLRHQRGKEALKTARRKLHNIAADYLGDADFAADLAIIRGALAESESATRAACLKIAARHTSTRERIALGPVFWEHLFALTGKPARLIDAACGLNPLLFFDMGLPRQTVYQAYDLHAPRARFLNDFFKAAGIAGTAFAQDVLVEPPAEGADVAFFFKEAHRLEQRHHGASRALITSLPARWVLVSLPVEGMSGRRALRDSYSNLFYKLVTGLPWPVTEIVFDNEMVFCIDKSDVDKS